MKAMPFRLGTVLILLALLSANFASAAGPPSEKAKIEALIRAVEGLKDARFIRNGREYDSSSAAKFLRGKWESHGKEIATLSQRPPPAPPLPESLIRSGSKTEKPLIAQTS
jgi:hypothetical protein